MVSPHSPRCRPRTRIVSSSLPHAARRPRRSPRCAAVCRACGPVTPSDARFATWCAGCAATTRTRRTSSPGREWRRTSWRCSSGAPASAPPPCRTAVARAWWAVSSRHRAIDTLRSSRWISPPSIRWSRSIAHRARRASRPASSALHSRSSSARTGSRSGLPAVVRIFDARWMDRHALGSNYATLYTHIDDFRGSAPGRHASRLVQTRRLPGSGAGPAQPERLFIGSEGTLGIITEAWMRLQDVPGSARRPTSRSPTSRQAWRRRAPSPRRASTRLPSARSGRGRALRRGPADEGHPPPGLRVRRSPLDAWAARALECTRPWWSRRRAPGRRTTDEGARDGAAGAGAAFLDAPYLRNAIVALGMVSETFETAVTWDRFPAFHEAVTTATRDGRDARAARASSPVASRTSTRMVRHPTTRDRAGPARWSSSSGRPSRRRRRTRSSATVAPSHTITQSAATIGRGTTRSDPSCSRRPSAPPSVPSIPPGSSTRACCSIRRRDRRAPQAAAASSGTSRMTRIQASTRSS